MKNIFKYCLLLPFFASCMEQQHNMPQVVPNPIPASFEICCWSFFSCDMMAPYTLSNTQVSLHPSFLLNKKYLILKVNDSLGALLLYNIVREGSNVIDSVHYYPDARFVIRMNYENKKSDTLVYYNDSCLNLNGNLQIYYPFSILDTIRKTVHINCFECPM